MRLILNHLLSNYKSSVFVWSLVLGGVYGLFFSTLALRTHKKKYNIFVACDDLISLKLLLSRDFGALIVE